MLSLKELLQDFSSDHLETLRKALHLRPEAGYLHQILHRLDQSERTRQIFAELGPTEKHVLRYLFSQAGIAPEKEVLDHFPDAAPAIAALRSSYVIFDRRGEGALPVICVPREYTRYISLTPAEKTTLANLVSKQPPAFQTDLAGAHGWNGTPQGGAAPALKHQWSTKADLETYVASLTDAERQLWNRVIAADGVVDIKAFKRSGIAADTVRPGHLDLSQPLDHLYALGLLFPNHWPTPTCFLIPSDIYALVRGKTQSQAFTPAQEGPSQLRSWGLRLLSDLQLFTGYQASGRLQFTQNEIPLRHQLKAFLKALGTPEEMYGLFLNMSIDAFIGALLKKNMHTLDSNPAESMSRVISYWRDGEIWQESSDWRDMHRSPNGVPDRSLKAKRLIVLKVLEELPDMEWVRFEDFAAKVFESGWKRIESGIKSPQAYYHNDRWPRKDYAPDLPADETLTNMTAESLVWLGMLDVGIGKTRKNGWDPTHVRLTPWGRQFLDKKSGRFEPLPPVHQDETFRVLPNMEVSVSPRLKPDLLAQLFKLAVLKGVNSFSITKNSLREAFDEGMTLKGILDFLRENSAHPLPPIVQQFIEEVAEKHGHIKLGIAGAYLQVDDPMLMLELRSQRSLKDIFQKQVGDRLAILQERDLDRIAKALRKMGYFPIIEKSAETERLKMKFHW